MNEHTFKCLIKKFPWLSLHFFYHLKQIRSFEQFWPAFLSKKKMLYKINFHAVSLSKAVKIFWKFRKKKQILSEVKFHDSEEIGQGVVPVWNDFEDCLYKIRLFQATLPFYYIAKGRKKTFDVFRCCEFCFCFWRVL